MSNENTDTDIWKVIKVVRENDSINSLFLEGKNEKMNSRKAGQYASIRLKKNGEWSKPHPFTVSCAPEDDYLQFTIKKAGEFTTSIQDLMPGTEVKVAGPLGTFCKEIEKAENIVMAAGGVGITPFLSVLRHFQKQKIMNNVTLIWVNRTLNELLAVDELKEMSKQLNLRIINSLSREEDVDNYFDTDYPDVCFESGRFSGDILEKYSIAKSSFAYVCGPPAMQEAAVKTITDYDIDTDRIESENFSFN